MTAEMRETVLSSHFQSKLLILDQRQCFLKLNSLKCKRKNSQRRKAKENQKEQAWKERRQQVHLRQMRDWVSRMWRKTRLPHSTPPTQTERMKFSQIWGWNDQCKEVKEALGRDQLGKLSQVLQALNQCTMCTEGRRQPFTELPTHSPGRYPWLGHYWLHSKHSFSVDIWCGSWENHPTKTSRRDYQQCT